MALFSQIGYHGASMRMIAKEAGIAPSSIYNHYSGKESILRAIVKKMRKEIEDSFNCDPGLPQTVKIEQYKSNIIGSLKTKTQFWRLIHSVRMNADIANIVAPEMEEMQGMIIHNISVLIGSKEKSTNKEETLLFWASIDGIAAAYLLMDDYPIDEVFAKLIQKYTKGE